MVEGPLIKSSTVATLGGVFVWVSLTMDAEDRAKGPKLKSTYQQLLKHWVRQVTAVVMLNSSEWIVSRGDADKASER